MASPEIIEQDDNIRSTRQRFEPTQERTIWNAEDARAVLRENPSHKEAFMILGLTCLLSGRNNHEAIEYFERSVECGTILPSPLAVHTHVLATVAQDSFESWYLLGRAYVRAMNHFADQSTSFLQCMYAAHEAYCQAFYRTDRCCALWISIGVLYNKAGQYNYCMDAFRRAIRMDSSLPLLWRNIGILVQAYASYVCLTLYLLRTQYEHGIDQHQMALASYTRALELGLKDQDCVHRCDEIRAFLHASQTLEGTAMQMKDYKLSMIVPAISKIDESAPIELADVLTTQTDWSDRGHLTSYEAGFTLDYESLHCICGADGNQ